MNTTYITLAQEFSLHYQTQDTDNKQQFTSIWDVVKGFDKKDRVAQVKEMKKAAEATIKLNSARREYKALLTMAENFALLPDRHINLFKCTYENLSRAIKLVVRINKHYEGDMTKIASLENVYDSSMSGYRYNNEYEKAIKALVAKYPAIVKEESTTTEAALLYADKLGVAAKTALMERLMHDLGYSL